MKTTLKKLREAIIRLLTEATCPGCGAPDAYIGMNDVECHNPQCRYFSKKQAGTVRHKFPAPSTKINIPKYIRDTMHHQGIRNWDALKAIDDAIQRDGKVPSEEDWFGFVDSTEDEMCPMECQNEYPEVADVPMDIFLPDSDSPINRWNTDDNPDKLVTT